MSIAEIQQKISPILQAYGIMYAGVFGSVARGDATEKSDVDLLVKLGEPMGMFKYMDFVTAIEKILGRDVDVVTEKGMIKEFEPFIKKDLKTIYGEKSN